MTTHGQFNWVELQTTHPEKAINFYQATAGWHFEPERNANGEVYWLAYSKNNQVVAGILTVKTSESFKDRWVNYIHIEDLSSATSLLLNLGGKVIDEAREITGIGTVMWIEDPSGAELGWVHPE